MSGNILIVASAFQREPEDRKTAKLLWDSFLEHGSTHSARASTLPYIIRRCETERIPYVLIAMPGQGYFVEQIQLKG